MSAHLNARRRLLAAKGRPMVLKRQDGAPVTVPPDYVSVTVTGHLTRFRPDVAGDGAPAQSGGQIAILNDEIAEAAWPAPPRTGDLVEVDDELWALTGSDPVYDGSTLIGWTLHIEGGAG
jgi:hypothetical protein